MPESTHTTPLRKPIMRLLTTIFYSMAVFSLVVCSFAVDTETDFIHSQVVQEEELHRNFPETLHSGVEQVP